MPKDLKRVFSRNKRRESETLYEESLKLFHTNHYYDFFTRTGHLGIGGKPSIKGGAQEFYAHAQSVHVRYLPRHPRRLWQRPTKPSITWVGADLKASPKKIEARHSPAYTPTTHSKAQNSALPLQASEYSWSLMIKCPDPSGPCRVFLSSKATRLSVRARGTQTETVLSMQKAIARQHT